jgi:hypothetical protein
MQIELSQEEAEAIRDVLQNHIRELDREINRTDSLEFKRGLQQTDRTLERILGRIVVGLRQTSAHSEAS